MRPQLRKIVAHRLAKTGSSTRDQYHPSFQSIFRKHGFIVLHYFSFLGLEFL